MRLHRRGISVVSKSAQCVLAVSLFAAVSAVSAQGADDARAYKTIPVDPKYQANLGGDGQRVLGGCIETLRKSSPENHIEAFIDGQSIKYAGTDVQRFQLEKCMAQYGFPIVSMRRPGLPN